MLQTSGNVMSRSLVDRNVSEEPAASIFKGKSCSVVDKVLMLLFNLLLPSSGLKMLAVGSPKMSVPIYQTPQAHISVDHNVTSLVTTTKLEANVDSA